ncbi:MAG: hypothetical protein ABW133_00415 [Polyangiaceae bacterium]
MTARASLAVVSTAALGGALHCGPLGSFRPITALAPQSSYELGLGAVAVSPRPYVDERWNQAGQLWFTTRANSWLQLSAISAFDTGALGIGAGATATAFRSHYFAVGVEAEGGYGWLGGSLPFALRIFEETWFYGAPRVSNFGIYPAFGTPVGVSWHVDKGAFVRFEYQASWTQLQAYQMRHHFGAGLAVQW